MRVVQLLRRNSSELKGWLTPACQWSLTHTGIDCRTIWHQDSKNGQLGIKRANGQFGTEIRKWTIGHRTFWHPDNMAPMKKHQN